MEDENTRATARPADTEPNADNRCPGCWSAPSAERGDHDETATGRRFRFLNDQLSAIDEEDSDSDCRDGADNGGRGHRENAEAVSGGMECLQLHPAEDWDEELKLSSPYDDEEFSFPPPTARDADALRGAYIPAVHDGASPIGASRAFVAAARRTNLQHGQFDDACQAEPRSCLPLAKKQPSAL